MDSFWATCRDMSEFDLRTWWQRPLSWCQAQLPQFPQWEMGLRSGSQEDYDDVLYKVVEDKDWQGTIEDHCKKDCYCGTGNVWKCMEVLKWALHIFERGAFMMFWNQYMFKSLWKFFRSTPQDHPELDKYLIATSDCDRDVANVLTLIFVEPWWSMVIKINFGWLFSHRSSQSQLSIGDRILTRPATRLKELFWRNGIILKHLVILNQLNLILHVKLHGKVNGFLATPSRAHCQTRFPLRYVGLSSCFRREAGSSGPILRYQTRLLATFLQGFCLPFKRKADHHCTTHPFQNHSFRGSRIDFYLDPCPRGNGDFQASTSLRSRYSWHLPSTSIREDWAVCS